MSELDLFAEVLDYYQELLDAVCGRLIARGLTPTSRVKTTGTLVDKLQRDRGMKLTRIQDLAGARIVIEGDRRDQDALAAEIVLDFDDCARKPVMIDRRASPRQGYRALHLVVYPESFPVEIQLRTPLQDVWAQIFERIADHWGRSIRYGGAPDAPPLNSKEWDTVEFRLETIELMMRIGDAIDHTESARVQASLAADALALVIDQKPAIPSGRLSDLSRDHREMYVKLRTSAKRSIVLTVSDRRKRCRIMRRYFARDHVDSDRLHKGMQLIGTLLRADMLHLLDESTKREGFLRDALAHVGQIPEGD